MNESNSEFRAQVKIFEKEGQNEILRGNGEVVFRFNSRGELTMSMRNRDTGGRMIHTVKRGSLMVKSKRSYKLKITNDASMTGETTLIVRFGNKTVRSEFGRFLGFAVALPDDSHESIKDDEKKEKRPMLSDNRLDRIEMHFRCPITKELMTDPVRVVGEDERQVFERAAMEEWIRRNGGKYIGPQTRKVIYNPILVPCDETRKQIEAYKEIKQRMIDDINRDAEESKEARISLEELEMKITQLEEMGALELAEPLRQRLYWLREYVMSEEGRFELGSIVTSSAVGIAVAGFTLSCTGMAGPAAAAGVSTASATKASIYAVRKKLKENRKKMIDGANRFYDRMENELDRDPERAEQIVEQMEEATQLQSEVESNLNEMEKDVIDSVKRAKDIVGGATLGGIGGAIAGYGLSQLAEGLTISAAAGAAAASATEAGIGGGVAAVLAANPVTCAVVGGLLAAAAVGFGIWYIGTKRGWWKKDHSN